ncbi:MAG: 30S ribosomal protein S8 [Candidatus Altiarchaeota archaeon]|nr:30S ribosomal protein S8 [Candidatus Altiarchaeota archaeon]
MMNDPLANLLVSIKNAVKVGKTEIVFKPVGKLMTRVLSILKDQGYVSDFEMIDDGKGNIYRISLSKRLNHCGAIKPRFPVKKDGFVRWERRFLPAEGFGVIIVSTSKGIMTHTEAKKKELGGKLIAHAY